MGERLRCRWLNKKERIYNKETDNVAKMRDKNKRKIKMKRHKKKDNILYISFIKVCISLREINLHSFIHSFFQDLVSPPVCMSFGRTLRRTCLYRRTDTLILICLGDPLMVILHIQVCSHITNWIKLQYFFLVDKMYFNLFYVEISHFISCTTTFLVNKFKVLKKPGV